MRRIREKQRDHIEQILKHFGFICCYYCNHRGPHIKDCCYKDGTHMLRLNDKLLWLLKALTSKSYPLLNTKITEPKII